jgi:hypothetical protein
MSCSKRAWTASRVRLQLLEKARRPLGSYVMTRGGRRLGAWTACAAVPLIVVAVACSSSGSNGGSTATSAAAGSLRSGSFVQADALGNTVIGGSDRTSLAFRFRATWTGSVSAIRCYVIKNVNGRSGYSSGTMGTMRVALESDSGGRRHVPSGKRLASATFRPSERGFFPEVRFDKAAHVVAGRLYHVVFTNIDSDPASNYVSINALYSDSRLGRGPAVPDDLAVLEGDRGSGGATYWSPRRSGRHEFYLPILDVVGGGGQHLGIGYMEVWDAKPIGGDSQVRQLVRMRGSKSTRVDGVWLRVQRKDGAGDGLTISIGRASGGSIASATVAPGKVPTSAPGWIHVRFSKPALLPPDADLALTLSSSGSSSYEAFPVRKGTSYGFDRTTIFDAGYAQFNDGNGWVGWDQWGGHDERNSDLQFALDVAR